MKTDIVVKVSIAISGFCFGFLAATKMLEKKYDALVDERIDACKESYEETIEDLRKQLEMRERERDTEDKMYDVEQTTSYANNNVASEYRNNVDRYATACRGNVESETVTVYDGPYIISPEEFGEADGYRTESLSYYSDHVLADEDDHKIDNVDTVVGLDSLAHFGEYEDDAVHVRNPRLKCDYEIILDPRRFVDL